MCGFKISLFNGASKIKPLWGTSRYGSGESGRKGVNASVGHRGASEFINEIVLQQIVQGKFENLWYDINSTIKWFENNQQRRPVDRGKGNVKKSILHSTLKR
jgi:hypothetical protein